MNIPDGIVPEVMPMGRSTRHSGSRTHWIGAEVMGMYSGRVHWKEISEPCLVAGRNLDAIWRTNRIVADGTLAAQDAVLHAADDWPVNVNVGWHPKKTLDLKRLYGKNPYSAPGVSSGLAQSIRGQLDWAPESQY